MSYIKCQYYLFNICLFFLGGNKIKQKEELDGKLIHLLLFYLLIVRYSN